MSLIVSSWHHDDQTLNEVLKLPYVARPLIARKCALGGHVDNGRFSCRMAGKFLYIKINKERYVVLSLP